MRTFEEVLKDLHDNYSKMIENAKTEQEKIELYKLQAQETLTLVENFKK
jgi:hypothetical protein